MNLMINDGNFYEDQSESDYWILLFSVALGDFTGVEAFFGFLIELTDYTDF